MRIICTAVPLRLLATVLLIGLGSWGCQKRNSAPPKTRPGISKINTASGPAHPAQSARPAPAPKGAATSARGPYQPWRFPKIKLPPSSSRVTFRVLDAEAEGGNVSWVYIAKAPTLVKRMHNADALVLRAKQVTIIVDYPIKRPWAFTIRAPATRGFTRTELVLTVMRIYEFIYQQESQTSRIKVVPFKQRKRVYNRNRTDGIFGIRGHDIGDLGLEAFTVHRTRSGHVYVRLQINS